MIFYIHIIIDSHFSVPSIFRIHSPFAGSTDVGCVVSPPGFLFQTMVFTSTGTTTLEDIIAYTGFIDPSVDLKNCVKDTLLRYISHLISELKSKTNAMNELKGVFNGAISSVTTSTETLHNSIELLSANPKVDNEFSKKLDTIESSLESINKKCVNVNVTSPDPNMKDGPRSIPITCDPYKEKAENVLPPDVYKEISEFLPTANYKAVGDQREVCYVGDFKYRYTGGHHEPAEIPGPVKNVIDVIKDKYETSKRKIISCMMTKYKDGDSHCPMHSDNERTIDPDSDIVTISIGCDRTMGFKSTEDPNKTATVPLPDNSLIVFSRTSQEYWQHSIPKTTEPTGVRYSLTFRIISPYFVNSTLIIGDSNTRDINFGEGMNCLGKWVPGKRIKASRIEDIPAPEDIAPFRNVIIHTGVNDINRSNAHSVEHLAVQLEQKCAAIHRRYPKTRIMLSPALPTKSYNININVSKFNECIVQLSRKHHNLILVDNSEFLNFNSYLLKDEYHSRKSGDLLHLGKLGLRCFAMSLKSYILGTNLYINQSMNFGQAFYSLS